MMESVEIELTDEQLGTVFGAVGGHFGRDEGRDEDHRRHRCGHWEREREWSWRQHRFVWEEVWVPCHRR